ncbi:MAG: TetR/AcrR family transcriptional regulator [Acidobacteriota bacterium]
MRQPTPGRREDILQAARQVFAREGHAGTRIQEVADACGIAKGTVYLYYRSKEELYWATVCHGFEELHRRSREALLAADGTEGKLRAFILTRLRFFDEERDFFRIYFSELGRSFVRFVPDAQLQELYQAQVEVLRTILDEGISRGEMRPVNAESTAYLILDLVRSRVAQRLHQGIRTRPEDELEDLFSFLWQGVGQ